MTDVPWFLKQLPDGRWQDIRYRFGPGTYVRITGGPYEGQAAVVDGLRGMIKDGDAWVNEAGYMVKLDDRHHVTIRWDLVEKLE